MKFIVCLYIYSGCPMDVDVWSITWQTTVAGNISFQPCPGSLGRYV